MKITRQNVLDAITQEVLMVNEWVGYQMDGKCPTCAVGATLRRAGMDDQAIMERAGEMCMGNFIASQSLPKALSIGNYLGALSIKWERICETAAPSEWWIWEPKRLERFKDELRAWVLSNLPDGVIYDDELPEVVYVGPRGDQGHLPE